MQRKDYEKWAQFDIDTAYDGYNMQYIIQTLQCLYICFKLMEIPKLRHTQTQITQQLGG